MFIYSFKNQMQTPAIHKALYQGGTHSGYTKINTTSLVYSAGYNAVRYMKQKQVQKKIKPSVMSVLRYKNTDVGREQIYDWSKEGRNGLP